MKRGIGGYRLTSSYSRANFEEKLIRAQEGEKRDGKSLKEPLRTGYKKFKVI